jgi:hypothetical protein
MLPIYGHQIIGNMGTFVGQTQVSQSPKTDQHIFNNLALLGYLYFFWILIYIYKHVLDAHGFPMIAVLWYGMRWCHQDNCHAQFSPAFSKLKDRNGSTSYVEWEYVE